MKKIDSGYCKKCGDQKVNNKCPHCAKPKLASCAPLAGPESSKVALEDLTSMVILAFCENLAELGCPKDEKNPDMWFRNLKPKQMYKVSSKLLDIIHSWDYKERV